MTLIVNITKKLKQDGFVQYENGNFLDKDDNIIPVSGGGGSGTAKEIKIAYASAPDGTGFTLTASSTLEYIAFKSFDAGVTPVKNDFAGLWYHRKGLPGTDSTSTTGADGQPAGFRINFSTTTTAEKPGTGNIRFNNANPALATEMYLDEMMPTGVDLSGMINQFTDGMMFLLRLKTNNVSGIAVFELTAAPTDNGDWFTIPVVNRAMSSISFANGDECTFQFFGGSAAGAVTSAAIRAAGNFPLLADNGNGGYKLLDNGDAEVKPASLVYKLSAFTITGVSNLPAANTFPHGAVVRLHQDCFVGAGSTSQGIFIQADAVNNIWRPFGSQILFKKNFGPLTAPTCSITAAGKFDLGTGGDPIIPAGLMNIGSRIAIHWKFRKVGTTTPTMRIWFGTDQSVRENNSIAYTIGCSASTDLDVPAKCDITFITATTALSTNRSQVGGSGASGTFRDNTTLINIASAMRAFFDSSNLASDTVNTMEYSIVWEY